jgi:hypothetical protein
MPPIYQSQVLDHLGLVAGMFDELGIGAVLDQAIPQDRARGCESAIVSGATVFSEYTD